MIDKECFFQYNEDEFIQKKLATHPLYARKGAPMSVLYPLKLSYILKSRIWAGTRLTSDWKKKGLSSDVGESWELSVRQGDVCRICNGPYEGELLDALLRAHPSILGYTLRGWEFPLLVKLIDAAEDLSVQVHPDDAYAARVEGDHGKTEMWYILDAAPDAELVMGLTEGTTQEDFAAAVRCGSFSHLLRRRRVRAGECYFIPSGLAHAIGAGILIAEIQQNSDLTYRVYDYDRVDANGKRRELHVKKALDVIRPFSEAEIEALRFSKTGGHAPSPNCLAACECFAVYLHKGKEPQLFPADGHARHLLCIKGEGSLRVGEDVYPLSRGDSYLLPAALPGCLLSEGTTVLESLL